MKKLFIVLVSSLMVLTTSSAMAYGNNYKHHGYKGHQKHHGYSKHRGHSYKHHRGHNSHNGAYLAGGLILGSLIAQSYHNHHYSQRPTYRVVQHSTYDEPVVRRQIIYSTRAIEHHPVPTTQGRHFYRDLEGNCFEIFRSDNGDELKQQLPDETCHW